MNVPPAVTGLEGYTVRLYVTLEDEDPQLVVEEPVGDISVQVLAGVGLAAGRNDMQAAIMGPAGESERSAVATWVLDQSKPKVSVISPKNNAQVKKAVITVKGKSQAGAEIRLQNATNGAIATTVAGKDNLWETTLAIADGSNAITVTATDPAGNENTAKLNVRKGSGHLTAILTSSAYRFKASKLPKSITLTVAVTGPDGRRVAGATALFTISVPGLEAIVSGEVTTNKSGVASFTTTIPAGATPGGGLATVLVTSGRRHHHGSPGPDHHEVGRRSRRFASTAGPGAATIRAMPVWRCPHCASPQPESSRCWVCRRSTTSCATCRHFRRGIAGGLGLCGLDPKRPALDGTEMRACWTRRRRRSPTSGAWSPSAPAAGTSDPMQEPDPGASPERSFQSSPRHRRRARTHRARPGRRRTPRWRVPRRSRPRRAPVDGSRARGGSGATRSPGRTSRPGNLGPRRAGADRRRGAPRAVRGRRSGSPGPVPSG